MNIYFNESVDESNAYTSQLLKYLLGKEGINVTSDVDTADYIFISLGWIPAVTKLFTAYKKYHGNKKIVVGGDIAKLDFVKYYADYVVRGEAYKFISELNKKNILDIENVTTEKKEGEIDYEIDFYKNPIIKTSYKAFSYYAGRGCNNKCKFCFYSWCNKYTKIPRDLFISILNKIPSYGKLYPTYAYLPYLDLSPELFKKLGMIDLRAVQYLKYDSFTNSKFILGIEFFSEEMRKFMGKPIPNEGITEIFNKSLRKKQELSLYFIVGLEGEDALMEFLDQVPQCYETFSPAINLKMQYINFNKFTPLHNVDIREVKDFNEEKLKNELNKKNRRCRVYPLKYKTHALYQTVMYRVGIKEEADYVYKLRKLKDSNEFIDKIGEKYPHLIGSETIKGLMQKRANYGK